MKMIEWYYGWMIIGIGFAIMSISYLYRVFRYPKYY